MNFFTTLLQQDLRKPPMHPLPITAPDLSDIRTAE
jgi:hypothetical protein